MKIIASEMLLMPTSLGAANRRYSVMKNFENPVPQTNYSMNALDAQGMSNMAFHGVEKTVTPVVNKTLKNAGKILLAAAGVAATTASCDRYDPEKYVWRSEGQTSIETHTTVNNTVIVNNYGNMMDTVNNHYNDKALLDSMSVWHRETMDMMMLLYNATLAGNQQNVDFMTQILAMYNEAMAKADDRDAAMDQFMADVRAYLEGILQNTNDIKINLAGFRAEFNEHKDYVKTKLDSLETVGSMSLNELVDINGKLDLMKDNQDSIKASGDSLISLVKNFHSDVIAILNGGISPNVNITKDDLQAMFNALGITVSDAISDSKDDLIAAIQNGVTDITTNDNQNIAALEARLGNIELKLDDIAAKMDTAKVQRDSLLAKSDSALVLLNKHANDEHADNVAITEAINNVGDAVNNVYNYMFTNSIQIHDLDSLIHEYAFDKLAADVDTMKNIGKDFVAPVLTRINQYIDYVMNIDTTYLDGSQKQMIKAILEKLNNLQIVCQCTCNAQNPGNPNEGVNNPTGGNIGDLFSQNNAKNAKFQEWIPDKTYRIFDTGVFQA